MIDNTSINILYIIIYRYFTNMYNIAFLKFTTIYNTIYNIYDKIKKPCSIGASSDIMS